MKSNLKNVSTEAANAEFVAEYGKESQSDKSNEWIRFGMRLAASTTLHPFEYSKVLMQLGFEPIAAVPGKRFFGKPALILPNLFQYTGYIYKIDGFLGCFRGLTPKLIGSTISFLGSERIVEHFGLERYEENNNDDDEELFTQYTTNLKRDIVLTTTSIIISHPFHVISIRMMCQFIGNETLYNSILGSIFEIYKNDGVKGFFAGLLPKLFCDIGCVVLTSSTIFLLNKYVVKSETGRQFNTGITQFIFSSLFYPLQVVSTCMTVTGSRLMAGRPPLMMVYRNSFECWQDLQARGQLKRGSSLFMRCYEPEAHKVKEALK